MNPEIIFQRFLEIRLYIGWNEQDERRIRAVGPTVEPCFADLIDDFYDEIDRHEEARRVITGGNAQVARLKQSLRKWLHDLFYGEYDRDYVLRRWQVGHRHVQIGLQQTFVNAAMSRLRGGLLAYTAAHHHAEQAELFATRASINRLIDCDLAIIEDAYQTEFNARQQRTERLAVIGQVSGGIAHELRNPLNVIKTSIYFLRNAKAPAPEKVAAHLERIDRQATLADNVITALHDFARLPEPVVDDVSPPRLFQSIVDSLSIPQNVQVSMVCSDELTGVRADERQLSIVLSNLIRNACDAMTEGGKLTLAATVVGDEARLSVIDTGKGIPSPELPSVMEPLFSTKARGLGLGLAIAKAIVEKHRGRIAVESEVDKGSAFTIVLPIISNNASDGSGPR
jgi:signal transduction histidine kinase